MWSRVGFGALCLATLLDALWIFSLVQDESVAAPGISDATSASDLSSQPSPKPSVEPDPGMVPASGVPAEAVPVKVISHTDGDTLHVVPAIAGGALVAGVDTTVRLLEIDTPESVDPSSPVQCFAKQASRQLAKMLPIGIIAWAAEDVEPLDPYGRTLLYLWTEDGEFVNLSMVQAGMAHAVLYEPNDRYIAQMRSAERAARAVGRGLWGACDRAGPRGIIGSPQPPEPSPSSGTDPRFAYCYEANDAGYGNYRLGRDVEYDWYDDVDHDGIVCEF